MSMIGPALWVYKQLEIELLLLLHVLRACWLTYAISFGAKLIQNLIGFPYSLLTFQPIIITVLLLEIAKRALLCSFKFIQCFEHFEFPARKRRSAAKQGSC